MPSNSEIASIILFPAASPHNATGTIKQNNIRHLPTRTNHGPMVWYNFIKMHKTLKMMPAMATGCVENALVD